MASVRLLAIGVDPLLSVLGGLLEVDCLGALSDASLLALEVSIVEDLKLPVVLCLDGPESLLLCRHLLEELLFDELLLTLMQDGFLLVLIQALEVVALDSVGSEHRDLSGWVLSHEVVGESVAQLHVLLVALCKALEVLAVTLFLRQEQVSFLDALEHGCALCLVLLLSLLKDLVEGQSLPIESLLVELGLSLNGVLLADLLLDPFLLLLLL